MSAACTITSLDDPRVADFRDVRDADLRGGGGRMPRGEPTNTLCMVESEPVIRRLLASHSWRARIKSMFLSERIYERLVRDELFDADAPPPVYTADEALLRAISGYRHHSGALAAVRRFDARSQTVDRALENLPARDRCAIVLAEGVTNVDNVGSLFRNAAAFGAGAVLLRANCADPLFRKAIRVSMGHVFRLPWAVCDDWPATLRAVQSTYGFDLIGAETAVDAIPLRELPIAQRTAFIFGGEKHGLSPETIDACASICAVPMADGVESINVAVASAVCLYEWQRRCA